MSNMQNCVVEKQNPFKKKKKKKKNLTHLKIKSIFRDLKSKIIINPMTVGKLYK